MEYEDMELSARELYDTCNTKFHDSCREGYLVKRGGIVKNWKKRWFVVQYDQMSYFVTKESKKPQKVWDLKTLLKVNECECENKKNTFCLVFVARTIYCVAPTSLEMEQWILFYQRKIEKYKRKKILDMY